MKNLFKFIFTIIALAFTSFVSFIFGKNRGEKKSDKKHAKELSELKEVVRDVQAEIEIKDKKIDEINTRLSLFDRILKRKSNEDEEKNNEYQKIRNIQAMQKDRLSKMIVPSSDDIDGYVLALLEKQDFDEEEYQLINEYFSVNNNTKIVIPSFEDLSDTAVKKGFSNITITDLLDEDKLNIIDERIESLDEEYRKIYSLDSIEYAISIAGGLLSALIDIVFIGLPENPSNVSTGSLSNFVKKKFEELLPIDEVKKVGKK